MLEEDIWRTPLTELTKLAKVSCKAFSYGVVPDPFLELRSSKIKQIKDIDAMNKYMPGKNLLFLPVGDIWKKLSFSCLN